MALQETHSWTLGGLIGAFIDLVLAYFLLCGSAIAFFVSKFFRFFGLYLPCPCRGSFGSSNSSLCFHKLLFEWPSRKICSIQVMAAKRFPFDLVWVKGHHSSGGNNESVYVEKRCENRAVELEDEASCSSCSGPRLLQLVDKENGYDTKGKRIMSLKRRSGIRRRRRGSYDCGKLPLVIPPDNLQFDVSLKSCLPCEGSMIRDKTSESINPASGKEVNVLDVENAQTGLDFDVTTCHSYELNGSMVDSPCQDKSASLLENYMSNVQHNVQISGNGEDCIKMLENALEEEKAAYAALYLELEKERAAAATAADEAMAMISRLQEEKALMEMEMRQYHRMIEERVVYDEEEMNILQEILIRRERENHFLEKELEAYRQMGLAGSDQSNGKLRVPLDEWGQRLPISLETHEDPLQAESTTSIKKDEVSNITSNYMVTQTCNGAEDGDDLAEEIAHNGKAQENVSSSFYDTEPDVLDVHVIDDNIELREEENKKIIRSSFSIVSSESGNSSLEIGSVEVQNSAAVSNCPRTSKTESDTSDDGPVSQLCTANSRCKTLPFDSGRDSSSSNNNEKLKIDIELLGEKLKMIQHEREKLSCFAGNEESEKGQLKLLEEITNHLLQIKQLRNPARGASLPPSSAKVSLRKRRCQSASWETCESS